MKKYFIAIALFMVGILAAADSAILRFAPDSTIAVVEVNLDRLLKHPDIIAALEDPESTAARQEIEKSTGIKMSDFRKVYIVVDARGKAICFAQMDPAFNLENIYKRNQIGFKKIKIAGRDVLQLEKPVKNGKIIETAVLAPGLILAGEKGDLAEYFDLKRGNPGEAIKKTVKAVPGNMPVWMAFTNIFKNSQGTISDPQSVIFTFCFTGKNKRDYALRMILECADTQGTQAMAGMVPMYANMGIAMAINDPAVSQELASCIKVRRNNKNVIISAVITEALGKKLSEYFKTNAARLIQSAQGDNASAPAGN